MSEKDCKKENFGRCIMGILMSVGTICGIWFASSLLIILTRMAG
jgi:hypothetical protein